MVLPVFELRVLVTVVVEVDGVVLTDVVKAIDTCVVESSTTEVVETSVRKFFEGGVTSPVVVYSSELVVFSGRVDDVADLVVVASASSVVVSFF